MKDQSKTGLSTYPIYEFLKKADIELYNSEDTGENIKNIYDKLYHYKLKNFKLLFVTRTI